MRGAAHFSVLGLLMAFLAFSVSVQADEPSSGAEWTQRMERLSVTVPGEAPPRVDMPVQFAINSAQILPQSRQVLNWIAQAMDRNALKSLPFQVEGHTDALGRYALNLDFSERRAQSVRSYLVKQGVTPGRLKAQGYSYDQLLPGLPMTSPEHRRVIIVRKP